DLTVPFCCAAASAAPWKVASSVAAINGRKARGNILAPLRITALLYRATGADAGLLRHSSPISPELRLDQAPFDGADIVASVPCRRAVTPLLLPSRRMQKCRIRSPPPFLRSSAEYGLNQPAGADSTDCRVGGGA